MSKSAASVVWGRIAPYALAALVLGGGCAKAQAAFICKFTTYPVVFGNYDPSQATATDGSGTVGVNCTHDSTGGNHVTVALAIGTGTYGSFANRQMQINSGTQRLIYNLYIGSPGGQIWGDGSGGYNTSSISLGPIAKGITGPGSFTIYGRIPAQQNIAAGSYADSVLISITP